MGVDVVDPADRDHMVFEARAQVQLGQFDLVAVNVIDAADVFAVGADDFKAFAKQGEVYNGVTPDGLKCRENLSAPGPVA